MNSFTDIASCIILAAGYSSRMGTHKALLKYDTEHTFLDRIIEVYRDYGINDICIVAGQELKSMVKYPTDIRIVVNNFPEYERFYSVQLGCSYISSLSGYCFIQNCDNPLINSGIIDRLFQLRKEANCLIPLYGKKGGHPVLIDRYVIHYINSISDRNTNLKNVLSHFPQKKIETNDETVLININTQEDYLKYFGQAND